MAYQIAEQEGQSGDVNSGRDDGPVAEEPGEQEVLPRVRDAGEDSGAGTASAGGSANGRKKRKSSSRSRRSPARKKGTDRQEVEWRFEAPDGLDEVEGWLGGYGGASGVAVAGEGRTKELSDTYYDTADWRIYRSGYALRVREGESGGVEATLKSLVSDDGRAGEARRREISEPLKGEADVEDLVGSNGPVGERLRAVVGAREVRPVFSLRTRRRTFDLILQNGPGEPESVREEDHDVVVVDASGDLRESADVVGPESDRDDENEDVVVDASGNIRERAADDGAENGAADAVPVVVGEVALDSSEIALGEGEEPARLSRVEVEVGEEVPAEDLLEAFVAKMRKDLALDPARTSKYDAGLFVTGQSPEAAVYLGPAVIDGSLSLAEVAFAVLRRQFAFMRAHEAGSRLGEDPEEVHDMRVATRRMRAAIKLYRDALPERARWIRSELKWIAASLGEVRDLDVQLEQLEEWSVDDEEGRDALQRVASALRRRREEARERLLEDLDSARYERFETSFAEMLKLGPTRETVPGGGASADSRADEPALVAAPGLLSRRYRKWKKMAEAVRGDSDPEEFHDLRKEGKRLRYALESLSDVYASTGDLIKPLKAVQDDLGRHQDDIVAAGWLRELATGGHRFPTRAAFAMGLRAQILLGEAAAIRENFQHTEAYREVAGGKPWKALEKEMKAAHPSGKKSDKKRAGAGKNAKKKK